MFTLSALGLVRVLLLETAAVCATVAGAWLDRPAVITEPVSGSPTSSPAAADAPRPTGVIFGKVVDGSSGRPVGDVTVVLGTGAVEGAPGRVPPAVAPRQVITDASGWFLFHDLPKGRYSIRAFAQGYLDGAYGQYRPDGGTQSLDLLADDEKRNDVTVRLWRCASITGTILDETDEPIVDKTVRLFRRTTVAGRARLTPSGSVWTDDRGVYRFGNLAPAAYVVGVISTQVTMPSATSEAYAEQMQRGPLSASDTFRSLSSSGAPLPLGGGYRVGRFIFATGSSDHASGTSPTPVPTDESRVFVYPTVYYPAAPVSGQATVVDVASGQDKAGIDLQLRLVPSVRVSGTVVGPDGPVRDFGVKLFPAGADDISDGALEVASTATDANGAFTFLGVTSGQYTLKCLRMARSESPADPSAALPAEPTLWATQPVAVGESDIAGVSVILRLGARISGRLVFEGPPDPPTPDQIVHGAAYSITPLSGAAPPQMTASAKQIGADGRFAAIGYPPGRYLINAAMSSGGPEWLLSSVKVGAKEVSDEGFDVSSGDIPDLVITFSTRTTLLSGTVRNVKGEVDKTATVIVVPADSDAWKQGAVNARRLRAARAATNGVYQVSNLPPGDYLIAAVSDETLGDWRDPLVLQTIAAVATRITLGDAETKTQDLTTQPIR